MLTDYRINTNDNHERIYSIVWFGLMALNATFNNISLISWQSVLLVEETEVPEENHRQIVSVMLYRAHLATTLVLFNKRKGACEKRLRVLLISFFSI